MGGLLRLVLVAGASVTLLSSSAAAAPTRKPAARSTAATPTIDWNNAEIAWHPLKEGLREARRTGRPICLVVFTATCPYGERYSHVFHDRFVVEAARDLVMIRVDAERDRSAARRYTLDGNVVPRTLFLTSQGELVPEIRSASGRSIYSQTDPNDLFEAMTAARSSLR